MSKIGILTFHNNENRGAILQAYALRDALADVFAADVEVVEYRTKGKETKRRNQLVVRKDPWRIPPHVRDRRLVENFIAEQLPTSSDSLVTDDYERAVRWIENQQYDLLVTGSDEVWKISTDDDGGFFSRFFPDRPFPNLYFLDPRLSGGKVAYAASGNTTDLDTLEEHQQETLREHLSAYDHVSVRDNHTEKLLGDLGIGPVYRVPDPTFLIDIPTGDARTVLRENGVDLDSPILGFHGPKNPIFEDICEHYRSEGYQIVTSTTSPYADVQLEGELDPFEYYALYDHFDMVVTSSLHSTIFSLKNGTPFATVDVRDTYAKLESKTYSLLEDFSLLDRHVDAVNGDTSRFYDRTDYFEQELDETHVENRIAELREQGYEFLEMVKEDYEESQRESYKHETDD